jgi:ParB/RepB/Spo0J family partition protein
MQLKISDIEINWQEQIRPVHFDEDLLNLCDSIKEKGMLKPVEVQVINNKYVLWSGFRRVAACMLLGQETIEATIVDKFGRTM